MSGESTNNKYQVVIKPKSGWQIINFSEIKEYRDLFYFLVMRDVKALYKQTILGFSWAILRPFIKMVVFSIVFGGLAKIPSDGIPYPLFVYAGLVPWEYFSTSVTRSTSSLITGSGIFTKVYFPRLILPFVPCFAVLVDFLIAMTIIFILMIYYGYAITLSLLYLPLLILLLIITASGMGMWLSAMAIQYRDVPYGTQFLVQILMYAAPVIYPISWLPESYRLYLAVYPMYGVIEGFRSAILSNNQMPWDLIGIGGISALVIFITGAMYFKRKERIFADVA